MGKEQIRFSKKIVTLVIILNVLFTVAVFYSFLKTGTEPTTLIVAWFAFTTGELLSMALIRIKEMLMEGVNRDED
ncbi:MAG: hypothetical protein GX333_01330 [Syntrophomonadaceae bacterium]|nr:hypothetical protein [Syntrophomonadaceae bacterium]